MGDPVMALACAQKALAIVQPPYYACIDSFCWSDFPEKLAHELRATLKEIL
jgi:hypothetical protein